MPQLVFLPELQWMWQPCSCKIKDFFPFAAAPPIHPFCCHPNLFKMLLPPPCHPGNVSFLLSLTVSTPEFNSLLWCCRTSLTPACFLCIPLLIFPLQAAPAKNLFPPLLKSLHRTNSAVKLPEALIQQSTWPLWGWWPAWSKCFSPEWQLLI